jgi:hypothetical protein
VTSVSGTVGRVVCSRRPAEAEGVPDGRETGRFYRPVVRCCIVAAGEDAVVET